MLIKYILWDWQFVAEFIFEGWSMHVLCIISSISSKNRPFNHRKSDERGKFQTNGLLTTSFGPGKSHYNGAILKSWLTRAAWHDFSQNFTWQAHGSYWGWYHPDPPMISKSCILFSYRNNVKADWDNYEITLQTIFAWVSSLYQHS